MRYIAARSLRRLPQPEGLVYDYVAEPGERGEARAAVRQRWQTHRSREIDTTAALFFDRAGELDDAAIRQTLSRRDDRVVHIAE